MGALLRCARALPSCPYHRKRDNELCACRESAPHLCCHDRCRRAPRHSEHRHPVACRTLHLLRIRGDNVPDDIRHHHQRLRIIHKDSILIPNDDPSRRSGRHVPNGMGGGTDRHVYLLHRPDDSLLRRAPIRNEASKEITTHIQASLLLR